MDTSIYFIALLPNQEIQDEITTFKNVAANKFKSKKALTSPPHITLVPPFRYNDEKIDEVGKELELFSDKNNTFDIALKDFNCFAPRVIYVDVMKDEILNSLYHALNTQLEQECKIPFEYKEQEYHPHITVAFKDLKEQIFPKAWKYFRRAKYQQTFVADAITLLKHDGKVWQIFKEFSF